METLRSMAVDISLMADDGPLRDLNRALDDFTGNARGTAREMSGVASGLDSVDGSAQRTRRTLGGMFSGVNTREFTRSLDAAERRMNRMGQSMRNVGSSMSMYVTAPVAGLGVAAVKTAADFEAQMDRVGAIAGATGSEMDKLTNTALELGANTSKSASEVAVGFENMAAMGFEVNEIIGAMPGVISAAEASGADMALTADVVASALNSFNLEAGEASRIADVLAQSANQSAADITDLQYAFKYAAPIANSLGIPIEELSAATGLLADAGMKGEQAGTTLRGGLIALLKPAEETSKMMQAMGITVTDAEGKFLGLSGLIGNITEALQGQTEVQKLATLSQLVGTEAASGFLTLMNNGPDNIDQMTKSLENSAGASAETAKKMKDNLKGALEELGGSLETAAITIGTRLIPAIQKGSVFVKGLVDRFQGMPVPLQNMILVMAGLAAAIGPLILVFGFLFSSIGHIIGAVRFLAPFITGTLVPALAAISWPVWVVIGAIAALVGAFVLAWKYSDRFRNAVTGGWNKIKESAVQVFGFVKPYIMQAIGVIVAFGQQKMNQLRTFWTENGAQIFQAAKNVWTFISTLIGGVLKGIWAVMKFVWPAVLLLIKSVWENIKGVINGALKIILGVVKLFASLFTGDFKGMWEAVKQIFFGAVQFIWNFVQLTFYGKILGGAKAFVLTFKNIFVAMWNGLKGSFVSSVNFVKNFTVAGFNFLTRTSQNIVNGMTSGIVNRFMRMVSQARTIFTLLRQYGETIFRALFNTIRSIVSNIVSGVRTGFTTMRNKAVELATNMKTAVTDRFTAIVDAAKALPRKIGDGIKGMARHAMGGIRHLANSLVSGLAAGINGVGDGINWVFDKIGVTGMNVPTWTPPKYAHGTGYHPGGLAYVGDGGGAELIRTPDGQVGLSPSTTTLVNLPRGTEVLPHKETQMLMNAPAYAKGTDAGLLAQTADMVKGAVGGVKDVAGDVWGGIKGAAGKVKDLALDVFDFLGDPKGLMTKVWDGLGAVFPKMNGAFGQMGLGALKMIKDKAISFIGDKLPIMPSGADFGPPFVRTSGFGPRWGKNHNGVDYAAPIGTPIPSQSSGRVARAGFGVSGSGFGGYGNFVLVDAGGGYQHLYAHNSKNLVKQGDSVSRGKILGLVGSTGNSTGPHVHYEVRKNGTPMNPDSLGGNFAGKGASMAQSAITRALMMLGKPMSLLSPLMTIAKKESGFDPNAINKWDINAQRGDPSIGLFQIIGSTFKRWMMPGHGNRRNPLDSALAAIRYMDGRYGGIMNHPGIISMMRGGGYKPYANGGIVNRPHMGLVGEAGPEAIIPLSWRKRNRGLALLQKAASKMGVGIDTKQNSYSPDGTYTPGAGTGARNVSIHYSPEIKIEVTGGGEVPASVEEKFRRMLDEHYRKLQTMIGDPEGV